MEALPIDHFRATDAILDGHFLLSSGLHSDRYLQCALVLMHPERAADLCARLRQDYRAPIPDIIIGPAMGGITLAYELGRAFGKPAIFVERVDGKFALRRGFSLTPGQKVMIAEDVVTTGGSVNEVIDLVTQNGAHVVAVACLVHRSKSNPFTVPLIATMQMEVPTWPEASCPLCAKGLPARKPGSRPQPGA